MNDSASRRSFLKAGLCVPAARLVPGRPGATLQTVPAVSYRTLGKSGLKVSTVGFGCGFNPKPDVVACAIDLGVNCFDTARNYGDSERILGGALQGKRDRVLISTKTGGNTREEIVKQVETSLRMLGTDHVDVLLLHAKDSPERVTDEMIQALEALRKEGKTRAVGLSTHDPINVVDVVLKSGKLDVLQLTYSYPIGGIYRDAAIKKLHPAGIGLVAMKAMIAISGIRMMEEFANGRTLMNMGIDFTPKKTGEAALAAIKWVLVNPAIATAVVDPGNTANLETDVRAMTEPYTPQDERLLYALNERLRPLYCRMCYECRGQCAMGLPVAEMLRFLAYNDFAGDYHHARANFLELPAEIRTVRCRDCASCTVRCPNGVAVRDRLARARELLA